MFNTPVESARTSHDSKNINVLLDLALNKKVDGDAEEIDSPLLKDELNALTKEDNVLSKKELATLVKGVVTDHRNLIKEKKAALAVSKLIITLMEKSIKQDELALKSSVKEDNYLPLIALSSPQRGFDIKSLKLTDEQIKLLGLDKLMLEMNFPMGINSSIPQGFISATVDKLDAAINNLTPVKE